jgi:SAM-dependent methyltransferase
MSSSSIWHDNLDEEVGFWRRWLTEDEFRETREQRFEHTRSLNPWYLQLVGAKPGDKLRIIDVGSGPVSTIGRRAPNNEVELICADALGERYNALLDELGFKDLARIEPIKGEDLTEHFGVGTFDIVNCANALDHFDNPAIAFRNMYDLCRPGGVFHLLSIENEGEREQYQGLHQWNLRADNDGVWLWNKHHNQNLLELVPGHAGYTWRYAEQTPHFKVFQVELRHGVST